LIGTVLSPAFTVGAILATLYGATVHMILGGDGRRLAATIVAAWVGFWIGQAIAQIMELHVMSLGSLNVLSASLGALLAAVMTVFLSVRRRAK
jgi:hypothetical protein